MREAVSIIRLQGQHLLDIQRQPSQHMKMGVLAEISPEEAEATAAHIEAWSVLDHSDGNGRIAACFGIVETFAGRQGTAWAAFASGLDRVHLALTKFAREHIAASGLRRIEAVVMAPQDATHLADALERPTPEMRWAALIGLTPAHLLRNFGAASETMVLFERISPWPI